MASKKLQSWRDIANMGGRFLLVGKRQRLAQLIRVNPDEGTLHIHYYEEVKKLQTIFEKVPEKCLVQTEECDDVKLKDENLWSAQHFDLPVLLRKTGEQRLESAWPQEGLRCPCCEHRPQPQPPPAVQGAQLLHRGQGYKAGSFVLVDSSLFPQVAAIVPKPDKQRMESTQEYPEQWRPHGRTEVDAMRPMAVTRILEVMDAPPRLRLQLFCRPEDVEPDLKSFGQKLVNVTKHECVLLVKEGDELEKCFIQTTKLPHYRLALEWANRGPLRFIFDASKACFLTETELKELSSVIRKSSREAVDYSEMVNSKQKLQLLDIFCGAGGLSKGLQMSGSVAVKAAIECDEDAAQAYKLNFPQSTMLKDDAFQVFTRLQQGLLTADESKALANIDMICAGSPCQGFSALNRFPETENAGNQRSLYLVSVYCFMMLKAKYLLMENVQNAFTSEKGKACVALLVSLGIPFEVKTLDCIEFGLPQTRKRTFLMAAAPGVKLPSFPKGMHSSEKRSGAYRPTTVLEAISDLNPEGDFYSSPEPLSSYQCQLRPTLKKLVFDHKGKKPNPMDALRFKKIPMAGNWTFLPNIRLKYGKNQITRKLSYRFFKSKSKFCLSDTKKVQILDSLIPYRVACTADKNGQWQENYRRSHPHGQVKTISATSSSPTAKQALPIHYTENRLLTPREAARLQGIPDDFRLFGNTFSTKMKQLGNAVPSLLAFALGIEISKAHDRD